VSGGASSGMRPCGSAELSQLCEFPAYEFQYNKISCSVSKLRKRARERELLSCACAANLEQLNAAGDNTDTDTTPMHAHARTPTTAMALPPSPSHSHSHSTTPYCFFHFAAAFFLRFSSLFNGTLSCFPFDPTSWAPGTRGSPCFFTAIEFLFSEITEKYSLIGSETLESEMQRARARLHDCHQLLPLHAVLRGVVRGRSQSAGAGNIPLSDLKSVYTSNWLLNRNRIQEIKK